MKKSRPKRKIPHELSTALLAVGAAFLIGGILGFLLARQLGGEGAEALLRYVRSYWSAAKTDGVSPPALGQLIWQIVRFPALAFVLGFTALGVLGLPALFCVRGFLLTFSVTCFVSLFGVSGGLLAFLLLGLSGVVAIPPLFILGTQGMESSRLLLRRGLGVRKESPIYTKQYFLRACICAAVLGCCILFDRFAAPALVKALAGIL